MGVSRTRDGKENMNGVLSDHRIRDKEQRCSFLNIHFIDD